MGGNRWAPSRKKISVCSLYLTLGRLVCLPSTRIQSLLWGFSARPSLLLLDLKLFCAPHGRIDVSESKFRTEKFFVILISHIGVLCEICKILHHIKNFPLYGTCADVQFHEQVQFNINPWIWNYSEMYKHIVRRLQCSSIMMPTPQQASYIHALYQYNLILRY